VFSGDPLDDYEMLMEYVLVDLETCRSTMIQSKVILEKEEYRFVEKGIIELNGKPDYRLQKKDYYTKRWNDIYLFDNQMQCLIIRCSV
jgi:hypothetical protein